MIIAVNFQIRKKKPEKKNQGFNVKALIFCFVLFFSGFFFPIAQIGKFTAMIILHFHLRTQFKNKLFHILHIIK